MQTLSQLSYGPAAGSVAANSKFDAQLIPARWLFRVGASLS